MEMPPRVIHCGVQSVPLRPQGFNARGGGGGEGGRLGSVTHGTPGVVCSACARGFCTALLGLTGTATPMAALGREWGCLPCLLRRQEPPAPGSLLGVGHAAPHFPAAAPGSPARPLQLIPTPPPSLPPPLAAPPQGFLRSPPTHAHQWGGVIFCGRLSVGLIRWLLRHLHTANPHPTCAFCLLRPDFRSEGRCPWVRCGWVWHPPCPAEGHTPSLTRGQAL